MEDERIMEALGEDKNRHKVKLIVSVLREQKLKEFLTVDESQQLPPVVVL